MNEVEQQPKTDAAIIMQASRNITAFGQLYLFIKSLKTGPSPEAVNAGKLVQTKIMDAVGMQVYINSNVLLQPLLDEFQRLGDDLEKNNIDVSRVLESLEAQFQQLTQATAPTGG